MFTPAMRAMICVALSLDAACAADPCRSRAQRRCAARSCSCGRFSSPMPEPSLQLSLFRAEDDPRPRQVVRRQIDRYLVARQDLDVVHPHFSRDVAEDHVTVFQLHPERRVGQRFQDLALHLYRFFLRHQRVGSPPPLKFAFLSRLSYCCDIRYACTCVIKSIVTTTMISSDVPPK